MYTVVPYRQANLVQVERVHKDSAQQPRSLETIFVCNESLSDHFIAFVFIWLLRMLWTQLDFMMTFIEKWISLNSRNAQLYFIEFEKRAAWERCALKLSRWLYEFCCCGWLPGRCEELALIPTRLTPHAHRKDWWKKMIVKKSKKEN